MSSSKMTRTVAAGVALICSGCGLLDPAPTGRLHVGYDGFGAYAATDLFNAEVGEHPVIRHISGSDLDDDGLVEFEMRERDGLAVSVGLVDESGDTLAWTRVTLDLRANHGHWVVATAGGPRPAGHCIGTLQAIPIRSATGGGSIDSLYVMHGSIPDGAIC